MLANISQNQPNVKGKHAKWGHLSPPQNHVPCCLHVGVVRTVTFFDLGSLAPGSIALALWLIRRLYGSGVSLGAFWLVGSWLFVVVLAFLRVVVELPICGLGGSMPQAQ